MTGTAHNEEAALLTITVRTAGLLKQLLGTGQLVVRLPEPASVGDLLAAVAAEHGPQVARHLYASNAAGGHPPLRVMINGRDIAVLSGRDSPLKDGDDVLVLTPIAGG